MKAWLVERLEGGRVVGAGEYAPADARRVADEAFRRSGGATTAIVVRDEDGGIVSARLVSSRFKGGPVR